MSRELIINRLDIKKDGTAIIRESGDNFICGRNDFTNAIAQLFYTRKVDYLVIDYPKERATNLHVKCEDSAFEEKEFDLEFASIDKNIIDEICAEYIEKDNTELERENAMLNDAYCARRNAKTVKDFQEFSDLIDELQADIDSYCEYAKSYSSYINNLSLVHDDKTETSYILLTLSE